jgi:phosphopantetheine--protein transferase-like protein
MELRHGLCVGFALPSAREVKEPPLSLLLEEEAALGATYGSARQVTFVGGRLALAAAARALGVPHAPILATHRGAPLMPEGLRGSISHKDDLAVALVQRDEGFMIGVDIERLAPSRRDVSRTVLSERELSVVRRLPEAQRTWELMARFSLKEALYKALDPFVQRYVYFREVEVSPATDGTAEAHFQLEDRAGPFDAELCWYELKDRILSTARVRLSQTRTVATSRGPPTRY